MSYKKIIDFIYQNISILAIVLVLITYTYTIYILGTDYWYDEVIVTTISKQSISQLYDTVLTEPHPLGFYLLLKLTPTQDSRITRIIVATVSQIMMLFVVIFGIRNGTFKKYNLSLGIALFVLSPLWSNVSTTIKQDAVTIPLLLLGILLLAKYLETNRHFYFGTTVLVLFILMFFGYINFLKLLAVTSVVFITRFKKNVAGYMAILAVVVIIYGLITGIVQYENNKSRFTWHKYEHQGVVNIFYKAVGGDLSNSMHLYAADIFFLISIGLFLLYVRNRRNFSQSPLITVFPIMLLFYMITGITRDRYIIDLLIAYFIFIGIYLDKKYSSLNYFFKSLIMVCILLYYVNGMINYGLLNKRILAYGNQNDLVNDLIAEYPTGIVDQHPIEPFIRKIGYFPDNNNAIPLSIFTELDHKSVIDKELIRSDGLYIEKSSDQIKARFQEYGLDRYIYINKFISSNYYDPENNAFKILDKSCSVKKLDYLHTHGMVFFEKCNFD